MKTLLALLCSVLITVSGRSQTAAEKLPAADESGAPAKSAIATSYPSAPGEKSPSDKGPGKKAEKEPVIEGVEVSRGDRGFLGVQIVDGTFKISFYDTKKKPIPADVVRAVLRWDPKYKVGQERVVLNLGGDGKSLTSPKTIRPPYTFKLFITLLKEATETADPVGETHVIDFRA